jgi:purine-binding chemotaxis protein CheW
MAIWEDFSEAEIAILLQRAKQLSQSSEETSQAKLISTLFVHINAVQYAFPIEHLVAVYVNIPIVPVPSVPSYIKGIANLRGYITPLLDLARLFNIEADESKQQQAYCILASHQDNSCAFYVQRVDDIQLINSERLSPISEQAYKREYLQGITEQNVILINTKAILEDESLIVDEVVQ